MTQRNVFFVLFLIVLVGFPALGLLQFSYQHQLQYQRQTALVSSAQVPSRMGSTMMGRPAGTTGTIMPLPPQPTADFVPGQDRTIIKTADLSLLVDNTRSTVDQVTQVTTGNNGLVVSSSIYQDPSQSGATQAQMVLRVPVDKLDDTLAKLRKLATKILQDSVTSEDETKPKVDLQAQIKNLQTTEDQLQTIMKQAKTVQETLDVEQQLSSVQGQIEVMNAELENLNNNAAMSRITLNISTDATNLPTITSQQNSIWDEIKLALKDMIRIYRNLFIGGIRMVILALPILVIAAASWFIWKRTARKS